MENFNLPLSKRQKSLIHFIAAESNTYAYDACFLDCAVLHRAHLLTLDLAMKYTVDQLGISLLNVEEQDGNLFIL